MYNENPSASSGNGQARGRDIGRTDASHTDFDALLDKDGFLDWSKVGDLDDDRANTPVRTNDAVYPPTSWAKMVSAAMRETPNGETALAELLKNNGENDAPAPKAAAVISNKSESLFIPLPTLLTSDAGNRDERLSYQEQNLIAIDVWKSEVALAQRTFVDETKRLGDGSTATVEEITAHIERAKELRRTLMQHPSSRAYAKNYTARIVKLQTLRSRAHNRREEHLSELNAKDLSMPAASEHLTSADMGPESMVIERSPAATLSDGVDSLPDDTIIDTVYYPDPLRKLAGSGALAVAPIAPRVKPAPLPTPGFFEKMAAEPIYLIERPLSRLTTIETSNASAADQIGLLAALYKEEFPHAAAGARDSFAERFITEVNKRIHPLFRQSFQAALHGAALEDPEVVELLAAVPSIFTSRTQKINIGYSSYAQTACSLALEIAKQTIADLRENSSLGIDYVRNALPYINRARMILAQAPSGAIQFRVGADWADRLQTQLEQSAEKICSEVTISPAAPEVGFVELTADDIAAEVSAAAPTDTRAITDTTPRMAIINPRRTRAEAATPVITPAPAEEPIAMRGRPRELSTTPPRPVRAFPSSPVGPFPAVPPALQRQSQPPYPAAAISAALEDTIDSPIAKPVVVVAPEEVVAYERSVIANDSLLPEDGPAFAATQPRRNVLARDIAYTRGPATASLSSRPQSPSTIKTWVAAALISIGIGVGGGYALSRLNSTDEPSSPAPASDTLRAQPPAPISAITHHEFKVNPETDSVVAKVFEQRNGVIPNAEQFEVKPEAKPQPEPTNLIQDIARKMFPKKAPTYKEMLDAPLASVRDAQSKELFEKPGLLKRLKTWLLG